MINEGEYDNSIVKLFENVDVSLDSLFNQIEHTNQIRASPLENG